MKHGRHSNTGTGEVAVHPLANFTEPPDGIGQVRDAAQRAHGGQAVVPLLELVDRVAEVLLRVLRGVRDIQALHADPHPPGEAGT